MKAIQDSCSMLLRKRSFASDYLLRFSTQAAKPSDWLLSYAA